MATKKDISPIRRKAAEKKPAPERSPRNYGAARAKQEPVIPEPRRERRALSHVGGEVEFQGGSPEEQDGLGFALDVSAAESEVMAHVHGFHSYPARLHPLTAGRLVERFSKPGDTVVDPFCGSGTVVVEAHARGRKAFGSDLNPLAVELSWLKSKGFTKKFLTDLEKTAKNIADVAEERRKMKAEPFRRYDEETRQRYPIHILLELDSMSASIADLPRGDLQRMLRLVVSSILTKVSYSEGDTTRQRAPRRLPSGFAIQLFADKTRELARRLADYAERLPERPLRAYVTHADARRLDHLDDESVNLVVTSPPYPGVYNYLEHHLHRLKWLGLRESQLENQEIGARRVYRRMTLEEASLVWQKEIGDVLREIRRILTRDGRAIFIIADSVADRQALYGDEQIRAAAERAGMRIVAIASQPRPIFLYGAEEAFSEDARREHVVILRSGPLPKRPEVPRQDDEGPRARGEGDPRGRVPTRSFDHPRSNRDDAQREHAPRSFDDEPREVRRGSTPETPRGPRTRGDAPGFRSGEVPRTRGDNPAFRGGAGPKPPRGDAQKSFRACDDGPRPPGGAAPRGRSAPQAGPREGGPRGGARVPAGGPRGGGGPKRGR